jgi:hypothetical protein
VLVNQSKASSSIAKVLGGRTDAACRERDVEAPHTIQFRCTCATSGVCSDRQLRCDTNNRHCIRCMQTDGVGAGVGGSVSTYSNTVNRNRECATIARTTGVGAGVGHWERRDGNDAGQGVGSDERQKPSPPSLAHHSQLIDVTRWSKHCPHSKYSMHLAPGGGVCLWRCFSSGALWHSKLPAQASAHWSDRVSAKASGATSACSVATKNNKVNNNLHKKCVRATNRGVGGGVGTGEGLQSDVCKHQRPSQPVAYLSHTEVSDLASELASAHRWGIHRLRLQRFHYTSHPSHMCRRRHRTYKLAMDATRASRSDGTTKTKSKAGMSRASAEASACAATCSLNTATTTM